MTTLHSSITTTWLTENAPAISIQIARREFLSNPPALQQARRERVKELLIRERMRGQKSPSYLAKHAKEIYGL